MDNNYYLPISVGLTPGDARHHYDVNSILADHDLVIRPLMQKCKEEAAKNNIGLCLPASNGIEWMQIYASTILTKSLLQEAKTYCQEKDYNSKKL